MYINVHVYNNTIIYTCTCKAATMTVLIINVTLCSVYSKTQNYKIKQGYKCNSTRTKCTIKAMM